MKFKETSIKGMFEIELEPIADERGWFARAFCKNEFAQIGLNQEIVQINHSFNERAGTFRGYHYQLPPHHETKIVRCITGAAIDFTIDLRKGSSTFLKHLSIEISAKNRKLLLIPPGCAHGFLTTEPNTGLLYLHTAFYAPGSEAAVRFDDPQIGIKFPRSIEVISKKDQSHPLLSLDFKGVEIP